MSTGTFAKKVRLYKDNYSIQWSAKTDKSQVEDEKTKFLTTNHRFYISRAKGRCGASEDYVYETTLYVSCGAADGKTDVADVFNAIWAKFKTRQVEGLDGGVLAYYKAGQKTKAVRVPFGEATEQLIINKDGRCGNWVWFMLDCMLSQGIFGALDSLQPSAADEGAVSVLVADWGFSPNGGTVDDPRYRYKLDLTAPKWTPIERLVDVEASEVFPKPGIPAQGMKNPISIFREHQIVLYPWPRSENTRVYDPSYGTGPFRDKPHWDERSTQGDIRAREGNPKGKFWVVRRERFIGNREVNFLDR